MQQFEILLIHMSHTDVGYTDTQEKMKAHPIRLMGEGPENRDEVYSWVMNNFWETNFKASLGGFYQFHYSLHLEENKPLADLFRTAEAVNENVLQFYRFE